MKIIAIAFALMLCGCEPSLSDVEKQAQVVCLHGHQYGVSYFSHSRSIYPLFDKDGKPEPCK